MNSRLKFAVCIATYQRREVSLASIRNFQNAVSGRTRYKFFITDGGSNDGTFESLEALQNVQIESEVGLYWNGAMRRSIERALREKPDFILLLNDDCELEGSSVEEMARKSRDCPNAIIVGELVDRNTGIPTYGRLKRRTSFSRIGFELIHPSANTEAITFNGNCLLIPYGVFNKLGNLDSHYSHSFGDIDLGLRAKKLGIEIKSIGKPVGYCNANIEWHHSITKLSFRNWRFILFDPKGVPITEMLHFCRKHAGPLWILFLLKRYLSLLINNFKK